MVVSSATAAIVMEGGADLGRGERRKRVTEEADAIRMAGDATERAACSRVRWADTCVGVRALAFSLSEYTAERRSMQESVSPWLVVPPKRMIHDYI